MEEKQALLLKEHNSKSHSQRTGGFAYNENEGSTSEGSEEWWEESHSSCSSCCDSRSRSSFEWEREVNEHGQLFYIESEIDNISEKVEIDDEKEEVREKKANQADNVKGGRLVSWIRRRDNKKLLSKSADNLRENPQSPSEENNSVAENLKTETKDFKDVHLRVENIGQEGSLSEKLLGLTINSSKEKKVVIVDIITNGPAHECKDLSIGDILLSINNYNITLQNIDDILGSLIVPSEVRLFNYLYKFSLNAFIPEVVLRVQKVKQSDILKNIKYKSSFAKSLVEKNEALDALLETQPVGIVVVDTESQNLNKDDVIYSYPEKCILSSCRGAFVTLFHLMAEITSDGECQSSCVLMKNQQTHVLYKSESNYLLLIAIPQVKCTLQEASYVVNDLMRNILFNHQTLKRCFETRIKSDLDHFFSIFFSRLLTNGFSSEELRFVSLQNIPVLSSEIGSPQFEDILPFAAWMPLPKEAQIQIDDALNELEANDIEREVEDNIENQRLFNIIGSCFFHKGYLVASHLPKEDLLDVHSFYRQNCLTQLFRNEPVKSLIIWREVFPSSCNRGLPVRKPASYPIPRGRWFLLIVGQGFDSLAVLLESGCCCAKIEENPGPPVVYVEEVEETLKHMHKLGISSLASQWIENNTRFKTITPEEVFLKKTIRKKDNLLGFVKSSDGSTKITGPNVSPVSSKSSETSPGKKTRGSLQETSEDSISQTTSNISEVSDENAPILGRRGERGKGMVDQGSDSDSSDSDWDSSRDSNMRDSTCSSGFDNFCLGDVGDVVPSKLTTGPDNLLFHYAYLDGNEGVLVNPPFNSKRSTPKMKEILDNFRKSAQIIHSIFESSIIFKKNIPETSNNFFNKSLVAVREHGVLFECMASDLDSHKKTISLCYWIVGRLFFTPQPREVYVCYYDDAPQNLIEIAFRLALSAAGYFCGRYCFRVDSQIGGNKTSDNGINASPSRSRNLMEENAMQHNNLNMRALIQESIIYYSKLRCPITRSLLAFVKKMGVQCSK